MHKIWKLILCTFCLVGCTKDKLNKNDFQNTYNSFVDSIVDNNGVESTDIPFQHQIQVEKVEEEYRYVVTIDQPKTAMYNIQMMVVDKNMNGNYPFIGLLSEEEVYSMIPNQENKEKGFVKGISLEGISKHPEFTLYIQVSWKDYAQVNTQTVFFTYNYKYEEPKPNANKGESNKEEGNPKQ